MRLTYSPTNAQPIGVYADGRHVGNILTHGAGYRYQSKKTGRFGTTHNTIREVQILLGDRRISDAKIS